MKTFKEALESLLETTKKIEENHRKILRGSGKYISQRLIRHSEDIARLKETLEKNIDEVNGLEIYPAISSNDSIDYRLMEEIAYQEVYKDREKAHGAVNIIRNILQGSEEMVGTNEELAIGYHGNKLFIKRKDWNENLERVVKLYVVRIVA